MCSNRTFMELKFRFGSLSYLLAGSNRTFMELKFDQLIIKEEDGKF